MNPLPCSSPISVNHKDHSGINSSASNALATAANSVALVGELKTPSLPSSVHIPSIMPSKSLLQSRNEVFKEIKDVGEDVAISSLHLFQGDMDLAPLSFHASLEKQWDEEEEPEEIETVLKVVPPAYHQHLDVFSKVKSEKLPPHHTCDHHIKLEGLLPTEAVSQFQVLKEAFSTTPILSHFNPSLPTIVETDASDYALGALMSQVDDSGKHPIAFDSCKLLPAELNYEIHDKELLSIVWALKGWRSFLLSLSNPFKVFTDHSYLQYFMSSKVLTHSGHFTRFLVTLGQHVPREEVDFISNNTENFHQVIKQDGIQESRFFSIKVEIFSHLVDKIQKEVWQDKYYKEILQQLARGESATDYSLDPQATLFLFKDRVVIPSNEEIQLNILETHHDSPLAGHPGQEKTLKPIKRDLYWAAMNQSIKDYVSSLVVDRFPKMSIFISTYGTITALDSAQVFINHVFSKHVLSANTISYRGSLFVSSFWTQLCQKINISRDLSTAFHPETDVQTERLNQILEQYLWIYFSYHQNDWYIWLPLTKFAYNNSEHSSTKKSPFFTIYGRNPSFYSIHIPQESPAGKLSTKLQ
ncbi:hypothetical protein O181_055587 [Austropuccinia psidii MF-1]|uniref:Integrase catalytic domain-containing protein n=1 Tax=Austropuccinia psidii MF-1 TaxID=1389203 RepID=A0A9Q3E950_9BASI|nr:hypothetical protein [Austropuccinia psidii MF-1]